MRTHNRYKALRQKHRAIEAELAAEMTRPAPDTLVLQRLKRLKLMIKDDIAAMKRAMGKMRRKPPRAGKAMAPAAP